MLFDFVVDVAFRLVLEGDWGWMRADFDLGCGSTDSIESLDSEDSSRFCEE